MRTVDLRGCGGAACRNGTDDLVNREPAGPQVRSRPSTYETVGHRPATDLLSGAGELDPGMRVADDPRRRRDRRHAIVATVTSGTSRSQVVTASPGTWIWLIVGVNPSADPCRGRVTALSRGGCFPKSMSHSRRLLEGEFHLAAETAGPFCASQSS